MDSGSLDGKNFIIDRNNIFSCVFAFFVFETVLRGAFIFKESELFQLFFRCGTVISFVCFLLIGVLKKYSLGELITGVFLFIVFGCGTLMCGDKILLRDLIFVYLLKGQDFRKCTKILGWSVFAALSVLLFLVVLGFIPDGIEGRGMFRLGFEHSNTTGTLLMILVLTMAFSCERNLKVYFLLLISSVLGILYMTGSRTPVITLSLFAFGLLCIHCGWFRANRKLFYVLGAAMFPVLLVITYLVSTVYVDCEWVEELNRWFSYRIYLSNWAFENIGVSWFGTDVVYGEIKNIALVKGTFDHLIIDNAYVQLLIRYGIVATVAVMFCYFALVYRIWQSRDDLVFLVVMVLLFYMLMESYVLDVIYFFPFLYMFSKKIQI